MRWISIVVLYLTIVARIVYGKGIIVLTADTKFMSRVDHWKVTACYAIKHKIPILLIEGGAERSILSPKFVPTPLKWVETPHWWRVSGLLALLVSTSFDWFLYLDADAYIQQFDYSVIDYLTRSNYENCSALFTGGDKSFVSSGAMFVRNDAIGRRVIDRWNVFINDGICWLREQGQLATAVMRTHCDNSRDVVACVKESKRCMNLCRLKGPATANICSRTFFAKHGSIRNGVCATERGTFQFGRRAFIEHIAGVEGKMPPPPREDLPMCNFNWTAEPLYSITVHPPNVDLIELKKTSKKAKYTMPVDHEDLLGNTTLPLDEIERGEKLFYRVSIASSYVPGVTQIAACEYMHGNVSSRDSTNWFVRRQCTTAVRARLPEHPLTKGVLLFRNRTRQTVNGTGTT